jgi:tetratricopeptide (TPR) repeat protein
MEKMMADIGRLLSERDFASIDEANAYLQELMASGGAIPSTPRTPLEEAQDLMYEAWGATGKRRVELTRRALKLSPDCADCYVLLAEETAHSIEEARALFQQGVKAGERAIGPEGFKEYAGDFWGIMETRPYMRARAGLAQVLWLLREREQAVAHLTDMLRLNPGDNQGLRYLLMDYLLEMGQDQALGELLKRYKGEGTAKWLYTNALWLFRGEGATRKAQKALQKAVAANHFVPPFLLGEMKMPKRLPAYIGIGDQDEAVAYVAGALGSWRKSEGALAFLAEQIESQQSAHGPA